MSPASPAKVCLDRCMVSFAGISKRRSSFSSVKLKPLHRLFLNNFNNRLRLNICRFHKQIFVCKSCANEKGLFPIPDFVSKLTGLHSWKQEYAAHDPVFHVLKIKKVQPCSGCFFISVPAFVSKLTGLPEMKKATLRVAGIGKTGVCCAWSCFPPPENEKARLLRRQAFVVLDSLTSKLVLI